MARAPSSGIAARASSGAAANALASADSMYAPAASSIGRAKPGSEARTNNALAAASALAESSFVNNALVERKSSAVSSLASLSVERCRHGAAKLSACVSVDDTLVFVGAVAVPAPSIEPACCILISFALTRAYIAATSSSSSPDVASAAFAMETKSRSLIFIDASVRGLCASVFNMTTAKARMYAASLDGYALGLQAQNLAAKASMRRSIFCASPGSLNPPKNVRKASSMGMDVKSKVCA
mmetsp:Transcript_2138/g.7985  ORF Transcript_2138/g.7985 Transcript_2138/m.7985 type:complete len:240 (+) Transcript_2138:2728-3447(+)